MADEPVPSFEIQVEGMGRFPCRSDEPVLRAMERGGCRMIAVGCRGGGCGICKIRVLKGRYVSGKSSVTRLTVAERAEGYALSCRLLPLSDLYIRAVGLLRHEKCLQKAK